MTRSAIVLQRFWVKVNPPSGIGECWNWLAYKSKLGYGQFGLDGKIVLAHRFAYEQIFGMMPENKVTDHLCRNPSCVNPYHLEAVTQRENILRGNSFIAREVIQTHCKKGHPLSGDNLSWNGSRRRCRICHNERERIRWRTRVR